MKIIRLLSFCAIAVLVSACVTPIPIDNLTYTGSSTIKTDKTAQIIVTSSGAGESSSTYLMPVAGTFISMEKKGKAPFGIDSQKDFSQSLRKELVRLGIFKSATSDEDARVNLVATINIDRIFFNGDRMEYKLELTMSISDGEIPFRKHYLIISTENDSFWERMNTNGAEARKKLAQLMLERLIPDIEMYASTISHP